MDFETRAIHAGQEPDPAPGAVMTPDVPDVTFAQERPEATRATTTRAREPDAGGARGCLAALEAARTRSPSGGAQRGHDYPFSSL